MYHFTPPTTSYRVGSHPLFRRINHQRGQAVTVYASGAVVASETAPSIDGTDVTRVYSGGRRYLVTDAEAATLTTAGYGAYLEAVV